MLKVGSILVALLQIFLFALLIRLVLDYVRLFAQNWRPRGLILYLVEAVYAVTDKPTAFVRRFVPPLRLGATSLDLSFIVLFFGIQLLIPLVSRL